MKHVIWKPIMSFPAMADNHNTVKGRRARVEEILKGTMIYDDICLCITST